MSIYTNPATGANEAVTAYIVMRLYAGHDLAHRRQLGRIVKGMGEG